MHVNNQPDAMFAACLLMFLSATTLSRPRATLGILVGAVEATTLATTPLIHPPQPAQPEAAWKYLLLCSVGSRWRCLATLPPWPPPRQRGRTRTAAARTATPRRFDVAELAAAAFLLMLVGYGTKMGRPRCTHGFRMPTAKRLRRFPPSFRRVSNSILAILRMLECWTPRKWVISAKNAGRIRTSFDAGRGDADIQTDFKRMLAYSSVEHMGILALGAGIGGIAATGSMFHALNHSLTKAALFLVAGNILARYKTKNIPDVRGLLSTMRGDAVLWIAGILAITGAPPFGLFTSELMILRGIVSDGHWIIAVAFLLALAIAFASMLWTLTRMTWGKVPEGIQLQDSSIRSMFSASVPADFLAGVLRLAYMPTRGGSSSGRGSSVETGRAIAMLMLKNSQAVPFADIPHTTMGEWLRIVMDATQAGYGLSALFAVKDGERHQVFTVLSSREQHRIGVVRTTIGQAYPALTTDFPAAHWFERELYEQYGIEPEGHPWLKPIRFEPSVIPGRYVPDIGMAPFFEMEGQEVHEFGVGPVHAGVIEPGHFRFQCHGETVHHLEISLGYQHRELNAPWLATDHHHPPCRDGGGRCHGRTHRRVLPCNRGPRRCRTWTARADGTGNRNRT